MRRHSFRLEHNCSLGSYCVDDKWRFTMGLFSWIVAATDNPKIDNPATVFAKPADVAHDRKLSTDEIRRALDTWEQDARQMMTASNEGMPGPEEGLETIKNNPLDEVVQAKDKIGEKP